MAANKKQVSADSVKQPEGKSSDFGVAGIVPGADINDDNKLKGDNDLEDIDEEDDFEDEESLEDEDDEDGFDDEDDEDDDEDDEDDFEDEDDEDDFEDFEYASDENFLQRLLGAFGIDTDDEPTTYHCGVLSGLSWDERKKAIKEYTPDPDDDDYDIDEDFIMDLVFSNYYESAIIGPISTDHSKILTLVDDNLFEQIVYSALQDEPLPNSDKFDREALIPVILDRCEKKEIIQSMINCLDSAQLTWYKQLCERGGILETEFEDLFAAKSSISGHPLWYNFAENDEDNNMTFVVPEQIMETVKNIGWEEIEAEYQRNEPILRYLNAVTSLRGIVPLDEALQELHNSGSYDPKWLAHVFFNNLSSARSCFELLNDGELAYCIYDGLIELNLSAKDGANDYFAALNGKDTFLSRNDKVYSMVLNEQRNIPPRPVPAQMLESENMNEWYHDFLAMQKLAAFFDARVPDDEDDYYYADGIVDMLIEECRFETSIEECFYILENKCEVEVDPDDHDELETLFKAFLQEIPMWEKNGWSKQDLDAPAPGAKAFYDEQGKVIKVGRNDPCPCGSGKKYKQCCGKRS